MSATDELQRFLSQPQNLSSIGTTTSTLPKNNPIAIAHAALQHLRDTGDPSFLFLRSIVEITSDINSNSIDPHKQELLFHCITGFRHVLLHRWSSIFVMVTSAGELGKEFCGICRDYLLELGMSRSKLISKPVAMACLSASASFWKRSWDISSEDQNRGSNASQNSTLETTLLSLINMIQTSSPSILNHRIFDVNMLFSNLEEIISYPINQNYDTNDDTIILKSVMASSFLSTLIAEFAGTSRSTMSYYNLSLEHHRKLCLLFQDDCGLDQILQLGMKALGGVVQRLLHESSSTSSIQLMDLAASIISMIADTISWDFHAGGWSDNHNLITSHSSASLVHLPIKWRDIIINPDFLRALFSLYSSLQQSSDKSYNRISSQHSIRQLILILSSLTGKIFTPDTRNGYAEYLVDGTLSILSSILPSIQSNLQEDGVEVVDMCCILSRIVSNFKLKILCQLKSFENLIIAISSVGCEILKRQLVECQRVQGNLEEILDEGWEWREEAWNHLLEGSVMIAEDERMFVVPELDGEQKEKILKAALASKLSAPLYTTYVTTRIEIARLEEKFRTQNADDVDEIREQISEVNLEEQMVSAACLGRLNVACAIQCLTNIWGQMSSRLHALFEMSSPTAEMTPDAASLLEEACLFIICLCHLLTDDNTGETPLIPSTIVEACLNDETKNIIVNIIQSLISLAEYHASRIVQYPHNPNLSPFLGKTILWFFHRWASSYILPSISEYSDVVDRKDGILSVWSSNSSNPSDTISVVSFCVNLCLHYYCYWPQEVAVQRNATKLMVTLAQRGVECRRLVIHTGPFAQLVALHAITAGAWHGASDAELDMAASNYSNISQNVSRDLVRGYQRISYEGRGKALQGLLGCCCDDDQKSMVFYECCLHSVQTSFSNLVQALRSKAVHPEDIHAKDVTSLCVFQYIGMCQNYHPDRIPSFLTPVLPELAGLMNFYAKDLSICESLLVLFRDYSEQYISVLDPNCCLELFKASSDLLRSYSTCHCNSRVINNVNPNSLQANTEEEQSYNDVLCAIQLLIHLGTKDFIDICSTENAESDSINSKQVTDVIFFGLQQILPLMTQGLLHYPLLCSHYFSLVGFMMDTYPEKACALPYDLFHSLLESLLFGMSHSDASISKASLRGIAEVAREHLKSGVLQNHLSQHPTILIDCCRRLLQEVIFQSIIWDRLEASGLALLPLVAVNVQQFVGLVNEISSKFTSNDGKKERLQTAFENLLQPNFLAKVVSNGFEGRKNRIAFKKDFEVFVRDVNSFLVVH